MNKKILIWLLLTYISSAFVVANAQEIWEATGRPVLDELKTGLRTVIFADVLKTSDLTAMDFKSDFKPDYTIFLVPRDSLCSPTDKSLLFGLTRKVARKYVLNHAFKGDLTIFEDGDPISRATFFPKGQRGGERHDIDNEHSVVIPSMGGDKVKVSIHDGKLYFGSAVVLEGKTYGTFDGVRIEVDQCGNVTSEAK